MIGFAGLSHLGIVSSIATASKGFAVVGYDPDAALCQDLERGRLPVREPDLPELLAAGRDRIGFTADPAQLARCRVIYLSQDVPTAGDNRSNLSALEPLLDQVARHAAPGATLVLLSQVPPGFTRRWADRLAAEYADRRLTLFYQVETLIFGRAVERATRPERFIVGCADPGAPLPAPYHDLLEAFGCPVLPMRYESAELTKIAINCCLVSMVTVANTLGAVCEAIGADWSEIVPALKLDRRIGPHAYLSPGLGLAGGNLERDLVTVKGLAAAWGTEAGVVDAWLANSRHRADWVFRTLQQHVLSRRPDPTIALWGLAYKPDTHSTKNSPALALLDHLRDFTVHAYDPQVRLAPASYPRVVQADSALAACRGADALAILTPWQEFTTFTAAQLGPLLRGRVLIDPLGVLSPHDCARHGFAYFRLGAPPVLQEAA
jgi:UDPglucose 6-dehydrogenase